MRITHKQDKSKHPYYMWNAELKSVDSCKDLGVYVSRDLSWSHHVDEIVNKANKVAGLLKRAVGSKNRKIFSMLCKSLVRLISEYACPVLSPYLVKDKLAIEKVQRRAWRVALGQKLREMSYEERCILLNWNALQHRKRIPICSGMLKDSVLSGLNGLDFNDYFEYCTSKNTRANHPYKIQTKLAKVIFFKYSFFGRIVKDWNNLPNHLFNDEISVNRIPKEGFKRWMKIYWHSSSYFSCIYFHFKCHFYYTILYLQ